MCSWGNHHWEPRDERRERAEGFDGDVRVSDADRERTIAELRRHTAEGRLTLDEFSDRVGEVYAARTAAELRSTLRELPVARPKQRTDLRRRYDGLSEPARRFLSIAAVLMVIWLLSGAGYFWPAWPLFFIGVCVFKRARHQHYHGHRAERPADFTRS